MKKNGNWTINATKKIFANDFFAVYEDKVIQPEGENGKYATIEMVNGASVLPVDDENYVYLTKQFRYKAGKETLECVAGAIEDETPLQTAKRELKEELGITAKEFIKLGKIQLDNSILQNETTQYIARKLTFGKTKPDSEEEMKIVKMKFTEAVEKVLNGEISHAPSCVLILKAEKFLK